MAIRRETVTITTSGGDGTSSGSAITSKVVEGVFLEMYPDYDASAPSTVDFTVTEKNSSPATPVISLPNTNTDQWLAPRRTLVNAADGSALPGPVDYISVADYLEVSIAQANNNQTFVVTLKWDDLR